MRLHCKLPIALMLLSLALSACGLKGDLYLSNPPVAAPPKADKADATRAEALTPPARPAGAQPGDNSKAAQ